MKTISVFLWEDHNNHDIADRPTVHATLTAAMDGIEGWSQVGDGCWESSVGGLATITEHKLEVDA